MSMYEWVDGYYTNYYIYRFIFCIATSGQRIRAITKGFVHRWIIASNNASIDWIWQFCSQIPLGFCYCKRLWYDSPCFKKDCSIPNHPNLEIIDQEVIRAPRSTWTVNQRTAGPLAIYIYIYILYIYIIYIIYIYIIYIYIYIIYYNIGFPELFAPSTRSLDVKCPTLRSLERRPSDSTRGRTGDWGSGCELRKIILAMTTLW